MLIISSSAKTLDLETHAPKGKPAHFLKKANVLQKEIAGLEFKALKKLLHVNEKLAHLNFERMQGWAKAEARPALFMYKGDVYRELDVQNYSKKQLEYAGKCLFAMSGLYGAVGALDEIKPYRLEMQAKIKGFGAMNDYWRPFVTDYFNELIEQEGHTHLLNLASVEYARALDSKKLKVPIIHVDFKEERDGKLKTIGILAKRARGMMIDFCIKNQVTKPAQLREFKAAGYEFSGEEKGKMLFIR